MTSVKGWVGRQWRLLLYAYYYIIINLIFKSLHSLLYNNCYSPPRRAATETAPASCGPGLPDPGEVPASYKAAYDGVISDTHRKTFAGMLSWPGFKQNTTRGRGRAHAARVHSMCSSQYHHPRARARANAMPGPGSAISPPQRKVGVGVGLACERQGRLLLCSRAVPGVPTLAGRAWTRGSAT